MTTKKYTRKDDVLMDKIYDIIIEMKKDISEIKTTTIKLDKAIYGNGQPGLFAVCNQRAGTINTIKWIAGGGGAVGIIALLISIWKLFNG